MSTARSLLAGVGLLLAAVTPAAAQEPIVTLQQVLELTGFEEADRKRVLEGEIVSRGLEDELTDTDLGVALAAYIGIPPDRLLDYMRTAGDRRQDPHLSASGTIDENDLDGSFAAIGFAPDSTLSSPTCDP